jgi:hypothetical protein
MDDMRETVPLRLPGEILALYRALLEAVADTPAEPGVPLCGACGSTAFEDITPAGAAGLLLKCLRCGKQWILAGRVGSWLTASSTGADGVPGGAARTAP